MSIPTELEALFENAVVSAHLATCVDGRPHVAPVWYVYEGGTLSVLTGGKKLANVRTNPRVSVSIERSDADGVDWNVTLLGTARVVNDDERVAAVRTRMNEKYAGPYGTDGGATGDEDDESAWGLVEIRVGSAAGNVY